MLLLSLFVVYNLFGDRMFSLLSLQETHFIDSFAEMVDNVNVIPISHNFPTIIQLVNNPILNRINQSRNILKYGTDVPRNELPKEIIKPNRVFIDILNVVEKLYQSYKGLPVRIASEKLLFLLLSQNTIITSNASDKAWVSQLKQWWVF